VIDLYNRVNVGTKVVVLPDTQSRHISATQTDVNLPPPIPASASHVSARPLPRIASRHNDALTGLY
jgi:hypothetical protein